MLSPPLDDSHEYSYLNNMSRYSVAEAKNNLPKLLDRMLAGEEVVITRRGAPIAQLNPPRTDNSQRPVDLEWLRRVRITPRQPLDAGLLLRQIRNDSRY